MEKEKILGELSEKYGKICRTVAKNILRNDEDAEEILNDSLLAFWNSAFLDFPENPGAWLCKTARNLALNRLEVDPLGLDSIDRLLLTSMIRNYNGGPVGLETIAAAIGEEAITIEDVYEPYLMQIGFLSRTPRGRCATRKAYEHLHLPIPGGCADSPMEQLSI